MSVLTRTDADIEVHVFSISAIHVHVWVANKFVLIFVFMCPGQSLALKCSATLFSGQSDIHVSCFLQQFLPRYSTCTLQFTILHTFTLHIPNTYTSNYIQTKPIIVFNTAFNLPFTIYHLIIPFCGFTKNQCP